MTSAGINERYDPKCALSRLMPIKILNEAAHGVHSTGSVSL